jgi:hypothetical protein
MCLAALPLGCSRGPQKVEAPLLSVVATLDAEEYRPGEAVVCTVTVTNDGTGPGQAGSLSADTMEFWFGPKGTDLRFQREVVRSSKEKGFASVTIAPKDSITRRFLLTRLTEDEGDYAFHALYSPEGSVPGQPGIAGPAFLYRVDGRRAFRRDAVGLIRKEDVLEVVKQKVGAEITNAEAKLVRNEGGFLDWWVRTEAQADGHPVKKAFFVNPYTGSIRAEAKPDEAPKVAARRETKTSP